MPYVNSYPLLNGFTKSNFKLHCYVCDCVINRGDEITQVVEYGGHYSITLRCRVINGGGFYTPETGSRWIHKHCTPIIGFSDYMVVKMVETNNRWMNEKIVYITKELDLDPALSFSEVIREGRKLNIITGNFKMVGECLEEIANNIQAFKERKYIYGESLNNWMNEKIEYITRALKLDTTLSFIDVIQEGRKLNFILSKDSITVYECLEEILKNIQAEMDWENSIWDIY